MDITKLRQSLPNYEISIDMDNKCKFVIQNKEYFSHLDVISIIKNLNDCINIHDTRELLINFLLLNNFTIDQYNTFKNEDKNISVNIDLYYYSVIDSHSITVISGDFDKIIQHLRNILKTDSYNKHIQIEY